jgi:hypothetical protein
MLERDLEAVLTLLCWSTRSSGPAFGDTDMWLGQGAGDENRDQHLARLCWKHSGDL